MGGMPRRSSSDGDVVGGREECHESGFDFEIRSSVSERISDLEGDGGELRLSTLTRPTLSKQRTSSTRAVFRSSITSEMVEEIAKPGEVEKEE